MMGHFAPMSFDGVVLKRGRPWDEAGEEIQTPKPKPVRRQARLL